MVLNDCLFSGVYVQLWGEEKWEPYLYSVAWWDTNWLHSHVESSYGVQRKIYVGLAAGMCQFSLFPKHLSIGATHLKTRSTTRMLLPPQHMFDVSTQVWLLVLAQYVPACVDTPSLSFKCITLCISRKPHRKPHRVLSSRSSLHSSLALSSTFLVWCLKFNFTNSQVFCPCQVRMVPSGK